MTARVYVDVLFIVNFITDYILLMATSFFIRRKPTYIRLFLSSATGGIYAVLACFLAFNGYISFITSALVAFFMVFLCYGTRSSLSLFKNTAVFYLVSLCSAGLGFSLLTASKSINFIVGAGYFYVNLNAYTMLLVFIVSSFIIHLSLGFIKKQRLKSDYLYKVTIEKNGMRIVGTALFDTGNFLREPFSQKSVVIAEWKTISGLFEEDSLSSCVTQNPDAFLYVPCRILGGSTGLYAFSPDNITSDKLVFKSPVLVAISETPLDKDEKFTIILPNDSYSMERM